MGHGGDVVRELTADHDEVKDFFRKLAGTTAPEQRREIADQLTIELVRHSVAEEQYLYPAVREHLDGGDRIADKEIADHAAAEEMMKRLEELDPAAPSTHRIRPSTTRMMPIVQMIEMPVRKPTMSRITPSTIMN
ncbi:hemerythrin domain-containing protein, partial [Streptomyces sp. WAC06614]|uniref:hemerythrin domain-containing protein n=1 Tax=Streptomyces sp. WAC06614 TaxID=2487416 RepID=UPI000F971EFB